MSVPKTAGNHALIDEINASVWTLGFRANPSPLRNRPKKVRLLLRGLITGDHYLLSIRAMAIRFIQLLEVVVECFWHNLSADFVS